METPRESSASHPITYAALTQHNMGFVNEAEQEKIRDTAVFICGIGGMGGACLQSLVRAGVTRIAIADPDIFEVSNLNRQVFAFASTIGQRKLDATRAHLLDINPEIELETFEANWVDRIDDILTKYRIVVNGMDDIACGIQLYRKAREHGATVIDAYTSPLPSVTVVRPQDPRPEERLGYPTVGKAWKDLSPDIQRQCMLREVEYVLTHSTSARYLHLDMAAQVLGGTRSRMSFAPMVITTGNLMCFEVTNLALGRGSGTDYRGYFFNPWRARIERPRGPLSACIVSFFIRRLLKKVIHEL